MDLQYSNTSLADVFIVKYASKRYLTIAILYTLAIAGVMTFRGFKNTNWLEITTFSIIIAAALSYFWYLALDKRPKIIISTKGIWTKKTGPIDWNRIQYYSLDEKESNRGFYRQLYIKLTEREKPYKISIEAFNRTKIEIHNAMVKYSSNTSAIDLGFSN